MADDITPLPPEVGERYMADYSDLVGRISRYWGHQYRSVVDVDDVAAELWIYLFRRWEWVEELIAERGEKRAHGKLKMRLTDVARGFVLDEHSKVHGYRREDMAWYTPEQVADLLPVALDLDQWVNSSPEHAGERRAPARPAEHGTRMAMLADVAHAFSKLSPEDREVLGLRYREGFQTPTIAATLDIGVDAAEKRCERSLKRLVDKLGGRPPIWPAGRKSISSAAARTRARLEYDA